MLTQTTKYAITLLRELKPQQPTTVLEISQKHEIDYNFLQQISLKLRRAGLTKSVRGPGGGIVQNMDFISLLEVCDLTSQAKKNPGCPLEELVRKKLSEINVLQ